MYNVIVAISELMPPHKLFNRVEMTAITIINAGAFATTNADDMGGVIKPLLDWETNTLE